MFLQGSLAVPHVENGRSARFEFAYLSSAETSFPTHGGSATS
jgi:hypothetical protein